MVGRYELCAELASGGMGRVYLARATGAGGFDKLVALKCIHPELATEQRFVEMFLDEARIASRIVHPNVCSVFEFGEADGRYYLAMEYLEGESVSRLSRVLAKSARADDHDLLVAWIVAQAAEGLHAAHTLTDDAGHPLEVVHRDVSPQNLFVTFDGGVRVVDFGIASARGRLQETTTGSVKGKFAYMSPEQMRREKVDPRTDVWALGVVLWELLTQQRMHVADSEVDLILAVLNEPVRLPSTVRTLDPALEAIVMKALAKNREERTGSARELAQALQRWIVGHGEVIGMPELAALMERSFPEGRAKKRRLLEAARRREVTPELLAAGTPATPIEIELETASPRGREARTPATVDARPSRAGLARYVLPLSLVCVLALGGAWALRDDPSTQASASADAESPTPPVAPDPREAPARLAAPPDVPSAPSSPEASGVSPEASGVSAEASRGSPEASRGSSEGSSSGELAHAAAEDPPSGPAPERLRDDAREPSRRAPRSVATEGSLRVETPGGWADVFVDGERRGRTPLSLVLPSGSVSLELRPFGLAPPSGDTSLRRRVTIGARAARVVVPLDP